jgi:hypothetical protein
MRPFLLCLVIAGCSSAKPIPPTPAPAPPPASPAAPAAPATAAKPAGAVGDACAPDRTNLRSTCGAGQLCMPAPGGYCTMPCGAMGVACPSGSVCLPTVRGGEICGRTCTSDRDCRTDQGYLCAPDRKACILPFLASPVLATCDVAAPPAGDFDPAVPLSTSAMPGAYQYEPTAALTPAGDLVVLFTSGGPLGGKSFLGVARVPATGAPVLDHPLATTKTNHFDPWVTVTRDGTLHAVWLGHDGGGVDLNAEIGYARSTDGGATWTTPVAIHEPADCPPNTPFCLDKPMIAAGPVPGAPAKEALRAFYSSEAGGGLRMRTSLDGGKTWDAPITVSEGTYGNVAIDGKGHIHLAVAMADLRGAGAFGSPDNAIAYAVSVDGKTFRKPITVNSAGEPIPFFFVNPSVAVDDRRGWIYVAYVAGTPDGKWDIQLAASHDAGKTWKRTKLNDDATCANHMVPNLALDPRDGTLHATFFENRGGGGHLAYVRCKPEGGACDRTVRVSSDMAAYELVRHSTKWLGEYEALVVDLKRHRLHAVWTQTVPEGDNAIGRLRYASRKLK